MALKLKKVFIGVSLVAVCVSVFAIDRDMNTWRNNYKNDVSLWLCVEADDVNGVDSALSRGADPNAVGDPGLGERHTLITAQANHDSAIVAALLAGGADPTVALHEVIDAKEARGLIGIGAKVNGDSRDDRLTPLSEQAADGHADVVEVLLSNGANPCINDEDGHSPRERALYAAGNHPEDVAEYAKVIRLLDQALAARTSHHKQ